MRYFVLKQEHARHRNGRVPVSFCKPHLCVSDEVILAAFRMKQEGDREGNPWTGAPASGLKFSRTCRAEGAMWAPGTLDTIISYEGEVTG